MPFDLDGASKDGVPTNQVADYLASKANFDIASARRDGVPDSQIAQYLAPRVHADVPAQPAPPAAASNTDTPQTPAPASGSSASASLGPLMTGRTGKLVVDGVGSFDVDEAFSHLSPEQQAVEVDAMVSQVRAHQANAQSGGASGQAPSPDNIMDPATGLPMSTDTDIGKAMAPSLDAAAKGVYAATPDPLKRGIAYSESGLANTADVLGFKGAAASIRNNTDQTEAAKPSSTAAVADNIRQGHYGSALLNVPGAVMEGLPMAVPAIAAGLATGGVGAPLVVGGLTGAATMGGDLAKARAAADGRTDTTATDAALGIGGAAAMGAVGSLGLGAAAPGLKGVVIQSLEHGAADLGQAAGIQAVATAGTNQGLTLDPSQIAAQAVIGAGTRTAMNGASGVADRLSGQSTADAKANMATDYAAMSPEDQATVQAQASAAQAVKGAEANATDQLGGRAVSPNIAARTVQAGLKQQLGDLTDSLSQQGAIDGNQQTVINRFVSDAANSQRRLDQGRYDEIGNLGLDPDVASSIQNAGRQLDILSDAGIMARNQSVLGKGLGLVAGHVPVVGRFAGAPAEAFGNYLADKFGLTQPALIREGGKAAAMLDAAGVQVPDTKAQLMGAIGQQRDAIATQAQLMGLDPSTFTPDKAARVAAARAKLATDTALPLGGGQQYDFMRSDADAMNSQFNQQQRFQRAQEVADAQAMDQQRTQALNFQRAQEVGDATAIDRQLTQQQNFQRAQQVGDAQVIDQQRERGMALNERAADQISGIVNRQHQASQSAQSDAEAAQQAMRQNTAPQSAPAPQTDPMASAAARAAVSGLQRQAPPPSSATDPAAIAAARLGAAQDPVTGSTPRMDSVMTFPEAAAPDALINGQGLPPAQYALGNDLSKNLVNAGTPKPLNYAKEFQTAVQQLQDQGMFEKPFAEALIQHRGRVVFGIYNLLRNQMLANHGVERRTLDAQQAYPTAFSTPSAQ